jgi:alkylation response protein AidB-like acyl-CoA dehydrogenase
MSASPLLARRDRGAEWRAAIAALAPEFAARAAAHDREASFPFENFAALREAGLMALTVPRHFSGEDASLADVAAVVRHVAEADASTALVLTMHYVHTAAALRSARWPRDLQTRLAREALDGAAPINALRVEPALGTPARGGLPTTIARRDGAGWRLSGRKVYATGAPFLRYGLVWARTEGQAPRVGFFLVPMQSTGVRIEESWDHLGMRASGSHDAVFEDVVLPADHAVDLRDPGDWAERDPLQTVWSTALICTIYDGVAHAARNWLTRFLHERRPANLGAPLATLPRFQMELGRIEAKLLANRLLLDAVTAGPETFPARDAQLVKHLVTTNAIDAVAIALELTGNPGLSRSNPLERHHRDVLCSRVHTPQDDMVLLGAGKAALGL